MVPATSKVLPMHAVRPVSDAGTEPDPAVHSERKSGTACMRARQVAVPWRSARESHLSLGLVGRFGAGLAMALVLLLLSSGNARAAGAPPQCGGPLQLHVEVGDPPVAAGSCFDDECDNLTITITQQAQKGTAEVVGQGTKFASVRYSASSVGADSFKFKANDGSSDSNEATTTTVNVDTTPPQTTIHTGPAGLTGDATPTFEFSASESGSSFECRVDEGSWESCSSPVTLAALSDGPHKFEVRATDQAGNPDQSPDSRSFTVDTPSATPAPPPPRRPPPRRPRRHRPTRGRLPSS